ncbi:DUF3078 domain-containing protein [Solitalea koreensis]|uniref:DUF3078 domain-containing protein n=1 Tax=Solitalea koreensis TaxID=543615 RepID=A0A521AQQ5_9SPHI|nr:DUF3078 domain-containing protein [Solitalea koreensis]SMO37138.1 Protein of unknown function [Solitalea koreensis]
MKKLLICLLLLCAQLAKAQIKKKVLVDTSKVKTDSSKIWNIHGINSLLISESSFSNWVAGGNNALAGNVLFNYDFNYAKEKWSWDNKVILAYGISKQADNDWRKTDDRIILNSLLGYKAAKYWLYTFFLNFQTQFAPGYDYPDVGDRILISKPFAPAYLSFGPGFAYKRSDNFRINFSPLASRFTFVSDDFLSDLGSFGVDPGQNLRYELGAYLDLYYRAELLKNMEFENILKLYSNYLEKPQNVDFDYTFNLFMKVNKFVSANFGLQLIYDDDSRLPFDDGAGGTVYRPKLQFRQVFGAGLSYRF